MGILEQFSTESYTWRLDIVQNLCDFWQFFLSDFLGAKCPNTPTLYVTTYKIVYTLDMIIFHDCSGNNRSIL